MKEINRLAGTYIPQNNNHINIQKKTEEYLRKSLRQRLQKINRREPLPLTYEAYLTKSNINIPTLTENIQHKIFTSRLRDKVEKYMLKYGVEIDPMRKCGKFRENLNDESMRAAFTLRECKHFEQEVFVSATLSASLVNCLPGRTSNEGIRKQEVQAMMLGIQERERKRSEQDSFLQKKILEIAKNKTLKFEKSSKDKNALFMDLNEKITLNNSISTKKNNFQSSNKKESCKDERKRFVYSRNILKRKFDKNNDHAEILEDTPRIHHTKIEIQQQSLSRVYTCIFRELWYIEFINLHWTNPFRIVIDNKNCAAMGIADYCKIVHRPMNLTYIKYKVENTSYQTLNDFFHDVDLLINNALLYNSDPSNEYHIAALQMKKKFEEIVKRVMQGTQHYSSK